MLPWSVMPTAGAPSATTVEMTSSMRAAPSSIEYSVCRCRCTNGSTPTVSPRLGGRWEALDGAAPTARRPRLPVVHTPTGPSPGRPHVLWTELWTNHRRVVPDGTARRPVGPRPSSGTRPRTVNRRRDRRRDATDEIVTEITQLPAGVLHGGGS